MTGLEKMISQIVDEAEAEAKGREEAARAEAEKIQCSFPQCLRKPG